MAGWLRPAASFIKRLCEGEGNSWEEPIGSEAALRAEEIQQKLSKSDPVKGEWNVAPDKEFTLWCDASALAMGAVLDQGGR